MAAVVTKSLLKEKRKWCGNGFTRNNIKRHEEACARNEKQPVKVKIDFGGEDKVLLVQILNDIGVQEYAVAREKGLVMFTHMHAYIKTKHFWLLENLTGVIRTELEKQQTQRTYLMNLETCKSPKAWLKYLTKEDTDPYLDNKDTDLLHDNYCMMKYVKESSINMREPAHF